ncbi:MAG: hypothetical protein AAB969_03945 [Patescibacteria group bacterium]
MGTLMINIQKRQKPDIIALSWLGSIITIVSFLVVINRDYIFKDLQNSRIKSQQETDNRIEILKDFYDGKPIRRSEAFWEHERGATGWTIIPETMAKKYGLNLDEVLNRLEDLGNQSLVWSPAYQPPERKM